MEGRSLCPVCNRATHEVGVFFNDLCNFLRLGLASVCFNTTLRDWEYGQAMIHEWNV